MSTRDDIQEFLTSRRARLTPEQVGLGRGQVQEALGLVEYLCQKFPSKEKVAEGFRILLSDPNVKAILVNIFGGIMNCATIADGVIHAAKELHIHVPIVVRLEGTNVEEGRRLFRESHLKIQTAEDLKTAAELAVKAAQKNRKID